MMSRAVLWIFAAAGLALGAAAAGQGLRPELQALDAELPGTLVNDPTRLDWATQGDQLRSKGVKDPAIPGGGAAAQYEVRQAGPQPYSAQAFVPLLSQVEKGDRLTIGFYARALSADTPGGKGTVGVRFQQNADPWPGFGDATVEIGSEWEWHEVSAVSTIAIPREVAVVALQLAGARQTVQIGQTIVVKGAAAIVGAPPPGSASALADLAASIEVPDPLKGSGRLIDRPDVRGWGHNGPDGSYAERDDPTIWLGKATRFNAAEKGENRWDVGASIPLGEGIVEGDKLLIAIAARTVSAGTDDGKAIVGVRVQSSDPPYDGFADHLFKVGPNWQLIRIETTATAAIPAGKATVALHFAEAPQVVDVGPVYVFKAE